MQTERTQKRHGLKGYCQRAHKVLNHTVPGGPQWFGGCSDHQLELVLAFLLQHLQDTLKPVLFRSVQQHLGISADHYITLSLA